MARGRTTRAALVAGLVAASSCLAWRGLSAAFAAGPPCARAPRLPARLRAVGAPGAEPEPPPLPRRALLGAVNAAVAGYLAYRLLRLPSMYIAALGAPGASSGGGAELWGLWRQDPGPRGVGLEDFERLRAEGGRAPAGWQFDAADWWLEEHGLIMEQPSTPLPPGRYTVTGDREVTSTLTVHPRDGSGSQRWELSGGAKLYDVTHLPCRSARYTAGAAGGESCSPSRAVRSAFPVEPGARMPTVAGCSKQDYAVLFVLNYEE